MADKKRVNYKGKEIKEYPKLIKVGEKKIRVLSAEDEAKYIQTDEVKEEKIDDSKPSKKEKPAGWGNQT